MKKNRTNRITKKEVKRVAELAKIKLSTKELEVFEKQFEDIISYFDTLQEVDTSGVEQFGQVTGLENRLRKDEPREFLTQLHALQNASKVKDSYIVVPTALKKKK